MSHYRFSKIPGYCAETCLRALQSPKDLQSVTYLLQTPDILEREVYEGLGRHKVISKEPNPWRPMFHLPFYCRFGYFRGDPISIPLLEEYRTKGHRAIPAFQVFSRLDLYSSFRSCLLSHRSDLLSLLPLLETCLILRCCNFIPQYQFEYLRSFFSFSPEASLLDRFLPDNLPLPSPTSHR